MKKLLLASTTTMTLLTATVAMPALSHEAGDFIFRLGAATVAPEESTSVIKTANAGALAGTSVGVEDSTQAGLNLVYMYTNNFGVEVLAATPFIHDLEAKGLDAYGFSTTKLGRTKQLPPTVTANYFFFDAASVVRPYVGIGVNYTYFFSEELSSFAENELGADRLELDDSWGLSLHAGVDWMVNDTWLVNASFWRTDISTEASFNSALGKVKVSADLDPWVYMISLGRRF